METMQENARDITGVTKPDSRLKNTLKKLKKFKKPGKNMFWLWIAYQSIKGTLTTSLIWIPLIYAWFHHLHS